MESQICIESNQNSTKQEEKKLFKCEICNTSYKTESRLNFHIKLNHEGKEQFQRDERNKSYHSMDESDKSKVDNGKENSNVLPYLQLKMTQGQDSDVSNQGQHSALSVAENNINK